MSGTPTGAGLPDTKQQIVTSLFSKRSPDGSLEETYIAHLKIWEDVPQDGRSGAGNNYDDGRKARYLMLAVTKAGKVMLHKAKRNTNMSFSKGKTWNLEDLRQVEVMEPYTFAVTMTSRTYIWQTERPTDQHNFLTATLKVYQRFTRGRAPQCIGISIDDGGQVSPPITSPAGLQPPTINRDRQGSSTSFNSMTSGASATAGGGPGSYYSAQSHGRPSTDTGRDRSGSMSIAMPMAMGIHGPSGQSSQNDIGRGYPSNDNGYGRSPMNNNTGVGGYFEQAIPPPSQLQDTHGGMRRPSQSQFGREPMTPTVNNPSGGMPKSVSDRSLASNHSQSHTRGDPSGPSESQDRSSGSRSASRPIPPPPIAISQPSYQLVEQPASPMTPTMRSTQSRENLGSSAGLGNGKNTNQPLVQHSQQQQQKRNLLAPLLTTMNPTPNGSPSLPPRPGTAEPTDRRGMTRRASFHPPSQSTPYSRDVLLRGGSYSQAEALVDGDDNANDLEDATMANVEEMLEGFDWSIDNAGQGNTTDAIEARMLDELNALDAANIHAFLETDDRIGNVLKGIDEAVGELNEMDSHLGSYKMQLNGVTEDIAFIESLNRGLQVQTTNQKALLSELELLLQNMHVDTDILRSLTQESLESDKGIEKLEAALASLYKALLSSRDRDHGDMAATMQNMQEYDTHNRQFCTRLVEYLSIMFKFQSEIASANAEKQVASAIIPPHTELEDKLGKYCGLILYMKEMDEERYQKLCGNYFSSASQLHMKEVKGCFLTLINKVARPTDDDRHEDGTFTGAVAVTKPGAVQRSKTVVGNFRSGDKKDKKTQAGCKASEAFSKGIEQILSQILREEAFIADFLQITEELITYADYIDLDVYFRRQASRLFAKGMMPATVKLRRSALDLIFGFLSGEIKNWVDGALQREPIQVFGITATCERMIQDAESRNAIFFLNVMQRQQARMQMLSNQFIAEQVKVIEATKNAVKRRKGALFFVRQFPIFVDRVENQLVDCDGLQIRQTTNVSYEKLMNTIFETLQHLAKTDRPDAGEEKGQLNYHIIMIENMYHLFNDTSRMNLSVLEGFVSRSHDAYEENLQAYIRAILRRSFAKTMDFFTGVQRQLDSSSAQEVASSSAYNKSALKRATKDISTQKDLRKAIDALSKRVEKHFSGDELNEGTKPGALITAGDANSAASEPRDGQIIQAVWTGCQKFMTEEVGKWSSLMGSVWGAEAANAGIGLEWSVDAVQAAMVKAKP